MTAKSERICQDTACAKSVYALELCYTHYFEARNGPDYTGRRCDLPNCDRPHYGHGYCLRHYTRWKRHKDPLRAGRRGSKDEDVQAFLVIAVDFAGSECLEWPFTMMSNGYGYISVDGKGMTASSYILTLAKGEPPEGKPHAAHTPGICHNPACVNPSHLRWASEAGIRLTP